MAKSTVNNEWKWNYCPIGGVVRVNIQNGEDIAHLDELDQKKWTVLSAPVKGLHMDKATLAMLDTNNDGRIHTSEVVAAAKWLTSIIKDKDSILEGRSELMLSNIDETTEEGAKILKAARLVLRCLGVEKDSITIDDADNSQNIFNGHLFNGDGVIVEECAKDERLRKVIAQIIACEGPVTDKSGKSGVDTASVDKFVEDCAAYDAWVKKGEAEAEVIYPCGADTASAYELCKQLDTKVKDYFMRCKLMKFDANAASAVDVSTDRIGAICSGNLTECMDEIASFPLAHPCAEGLLDLDGINPAWSGIIAKVSAMTGLKGKIAEEDWNRVMASFVPYCAHMAAKAGAAVEGLGTQAVADILADNPKEALHAIIAADLELADEAAEISSIGKLMHLYRDLYQLLNNYVVFGDLYARGRRAAFEAGELYIDRRCCKLCIEVDDMGKHADMANLSGMFLIYCTCTDKAGNKKNIAALMTAGDTAAIRPGKNAIFYDLDGNDWDAVVTKVVDNPINVRNAFWSPYRKAVEFVTDKITKGVSGKAAEAEANLIAKVDGKDAPAFDIAKFAGIFAAIGMAFGLVLDALTGIMKGFLGLGWMERLGLVLGIILLISGPSCFLAWMKLRKRNLGPILNANGWAINSVVLINTVFGATLTSVARYPVVNGKDPFRQKRSAWKICLAVFVICAGIACAACHYLKIFG